jgi:hypothetical protein
MPFVRFGPIQSREARTTEKMNRATPSRALDLFCARGLVFIVLSLSVLRCGWVSSSFDPTVDDVKQRVGEFVVPGASSVDGVYGNADIEMLVATYCVPNGPALAKSVHATVAKRGWLLRERTREGMVFERQSIRAYELVELRPLPDTRCAALSWVRTFEGGKTPYDSRQITKGREVTRVMAETIRKRMVGDERG